MDMFAVSLTEEIGPTRAERRKGFVQPTQKICDEVLVVMSPELFKRTKVFLYFLVATENDVHLKCSTFVIRPSIVHHPSYIWYLCKSSFSFTEKFF